MAENLCEIEEKNSKYIKSNDFLFEKDEHNNTNQHSSSSSSSTKNILATFNILEDEGEQEETQENIQKKYIVEETKLIMIQNSIHNMNKYNQIEVGKILHSYKNITLNENRYGIFMNLTELDEAVIQKLYEYIFYTNEQENSLSKIENEKKEFKNKYFTIRVEDL